MIVDLYSRRQRQAAGGVDVYQYDNVPRTLRVQVIQILNHGFGEGAAWNTVIGILRREYGLFKLSEKFCPNIGDELRKFLLDAETEACIDTIELACRALDKVCAKDGYLHRYMGMAKEISDECIEEINVRMRQASFGFEYKSGFLIRIDSQYIHAESVLPALNALHLDPMYAGAETEFLKAHGAYRSGDASTALVECCKSFESIMKSICDKRGWSYDNDKDTASKLVGICYAAGLIPAYWQSHFAGLRSILESALPTPRNKTSGHGAGSTPVAVPMELASYVLHMTAATLLFLAEAEKALP